MKYLHTPLICKLNENGNKVKLSKRKHPEADARYFVRLGFPIVAINEYLLNLANSDFEIWRVKNPDLHYSKFPFSISKMGSNNPMFDIIKLSDISKTIISKMTAEEVYQYVFTWAKEFDSEFASYLDSHREYATKVFSIDRYTPKPRKDIAKWSDIKCYFSYMFEPYFKLNSLEDYEIFGEGNINESDKKKLVKDIELVLSNYLDNYRQFEEKQDWFDNIKKMSSYLGFATDNKEYKATPEKFKGTVSDVCMYIRIAITGRRNSPDLYELCKILGEMNTKERLKKLLLKIRGNKF
jgi:glutamyl-tRNA synthetase